MLLERVPVRFRLSIIHTAWITVLYFIIGCGFFKVVEHTLLRSVDSSLLSSAHSIRESAHFGGTVLPEIFLDGILYNKSQFSLFMPERLIKPYARIISLEENSISNLIRSEVKLPITPKTLDRAERGLYTLETFKFKDRPPLRQVSLPLLHKGEFTGELVQVGASLAPTQSIMKGTAVLLWLLLPLIILISIILGYILTAQALKPVRLMSKSASKLGADDLHIRLEVPTAIDELRELSLTFNKMLDRLEDAISRLRRFTADVSHELRTPLAVLRAEAELSLRKERSSEDYKTALTTIQQESKHMTVIVEDLLLLARVESSNLVCSWEATSTHQFIEDLLASVQSIFKNREINIDLQVDAPDTFTCSKTYLSLALKNILLNACKHSIPKSTVHFHIHSEKKKILFTIRDEGEGISETDLPYIFDPFYRSDTARNRAMGGVGIGLSLTQAMIKLHKGEIEVQSKLGAGTSFTAKIPI